MFELDDLPLLPLERVIDYLDYPSRRTCRLVSQKMKYLVDDLGLSIKIDCRDPGSLALAKTVTATEARLLYLTSSSNLGEEELRTWKIAVISGPVNNTWLNDCMLRNCSNLRILVLNHDALTLVEFKASSELIPGFHRLSELHINLKSYDEALKTLFPDDPNRYRFMNFMGSLVQKNVVYFFSIIRSQVLKLLHVTVYDPDESAHEVHWEHQPLFEFLENHRNSLETIILPSLTFREPTGQLGNLQIPTNLKGIQLVPDGFSGKSLPMYWKNLLFNQRSLEKLYVSRLRPPLGVPPFPWLPSLISNNAKTLTFIHLTLSVAKEDQAGVFQETLDMRSFAGLESLRSMEIFGSGAVTICNLNDLPTRSLTKLSLSAKIDADFDGIRFLESMNPRHLRLTTISSDSYFKDPEYTLKFIKRALRIRNMDAFGFWISTTADSSYLTTAYPEVGDSHFEPWIAKLEAEHFINPSGFWLENVNYGITQLVASDTERMWYRYGDMDYMEMITMRNFFGRLLYEPPFFPNRNADSFSLWVKNVPGPRSESHRFLENRKSYSQMVSDIGQMRIHFTAALEREGDIPDESVIEPVGLHDMGVSSDTLVDKKCILTFYSL